MEIEKYVETETEIAIEKHKPSLTVRDTPMYVSRSVSVGK